MSGAEHAAAEPYIRYTRTAGTDLAGWLIKEGRTLKKALPRYMHVSGATLSNHRHESQAPTWTIPLTNCHVLCGARRHELIIHLMHRRLHLIAPTNLEFRQWLFALRRAAASSPSLSTFYSVGDVIGDGINGDVYSGRDRATDEPVAIKSLPWLATASCNENAVTEEEIRIARSLDHPNLVKTFDIFRDVANAKVHMVMEYVAGGELRARVDVPAGSLVKEPDAIRIARLLLSAVRYLHDCGIVHRDIKLENVLCIDADVEKPLRVKLADFGSSTTLSTKRQTLNSAVGTGYYLPPEIIEEKDYGPPVDLWACGVLFYISLSSQLPFAGIEVEEYFENVLANDVEFPDDIWNDISREAQDFIRRLMERDPAKRLTAKEALHHRWLVDANIESVENDGDCSSTDGEEDVMALMDGPRSLLFGKKMTVAEILAKKKEKHS